MNVFCKVFRFYYEGFRSMTLGKTLWIIIAIIVAVICCCCIVAIVWGNNLMKEFNIEDFEDLMNEFSQIIKLAPAFI